MITQRLARITISAFALSPSRRALRSSELTLTPIKTIARKMMK